MARLNASDDYEFLYGGYNANNIFRYMPPNSIDTNGDNITGTTVSINAFFETPWINLAKVLGAPNWERSRVVPSYLKLYAGGEPATGNSTISLVTNYYTDFSTTIRGTFTTTHNAAAWPTVKIDPKMIYFGGSLGSFYWLKLKVTNNTLNEHFKIYKMLFGLRLKPAIH